MSGSIRLFVNAALHAGAEIPVTPAQARYLGTVMRRAPGDGVLLLNGRDGEWAARIAAMSRDRAVLSVDRLIRPQRDGPDMWLAFALLKREATSLVVQKATELGVAALLPVMTARTRSTPFNPARLTAIVTEAAEQSERLTLPRLEPPRPLSGLLADWPHDRRLFAAIERSDAPGVPRASGPAGLLVGPEGGFTAEEQAALAAHPAVTRVSLGETVLRAETACIVGLALLQVPRGR